MNKRKVTAFTIGALGGMVAMLYAYAKGYDRGEKWGRAMGELTGSMRGAADLARSMTEARFGKK